MYNTRDLEEEINLTLLSEAINAGQSFNTPMTGRRNDMDRIKDIKKRNRLWVNQLFNRLLLLLTVKL